MAKDGEPVELRCGERDVTISRPAKALFPDGTTKLDLARYYAAVGETMLPHVADRPLNLERYPDGIERQRIMQQHAAEHFPDWIGRVEVPKRGGTVATSSRATSRRSSTSRTRPASRSTPGRAAATGSTGRIA